jgi:opacity protein-like surface antigen
MGASAGLSVPTGDRGEFLKPGFDVGAHLAFRPAALPVGVRVEGQFNRFAVHFDEDEMPGMRAEGNVQLIGGTASVVLGVPAASSPLRPYLMGGVGIYNRRGSVRVTFEGVTDSGSDSRTDSGVNGGAGIELGLGGLTAFLEARYHVALDAPDEEEFEGIQNTRFIPISVGIRF